MIKMAFQNDQTGTIVGKNKRETEIPVAKKTERTFWQEMRKYRKASKTKLKEK